MNIPIVDLAAQYKSIEAEIDSAIKSVLTNSKFILGPSVAELERKIAAYCECEYAVAVGSGTDALLFALLALGIGRGDEVITTPFTFIASAAAISRAGAKPVFVDVDARTFNLDVKLIEQKITSKTRAILPVHLFGQPAQMDEIQQLARNYDLRVIEDAVQSIGARYQGKRVGALGDAGALSFYPTKNLGAYGDGGMVLTNQRAVAEQVKLLRQQGETRKYVHAEIGFNSRLDTLQAQVLCVKLGHLDVWNAKRREAAARYDALFAHSCVVPPFEARGGCHVYHQYTIQTPHHRDELQAYLKKHGIEAIAYYPLSLHQQPAFRSLGYAEGQLPVSERLANSVLSLPCFPEITREQQEYVVATIHDFYAEAYTHRVRQFA